MRHDTLPDWDDITRALANGDAEGAAATNPGAERARQIWHALPPRSHQQIDRQALWGRLVADLEFPPTETPIPPRRPAVRKSQGMPGRHLGWGRWVGVAALAGIVGYGAWHFVPNTRDGRPAMAASRVTQHITARGERALVHLDDGTRIHLNVASRLHVVQWNAQERTVELEGEAQFTVTHDPARPFVVRANGTMIRDLATVFNVKSYPHSGTTRVAVLDGRVSVQSPVTAGANAAVLKASEFATVNASGAVEHGRIGNLRAESGWVDGFLVLDHVELGDALSQLSRWYAVEFRVSDPAMVHRRVNLTLPHQMTRQTLADLADVLDATVVRQDSVIVFSPRRS